MLPFGAAEVARLRLLAPLAEAVAPPVSFCEATIFLAPRYSPLRQLSVRDAARAWVLSDLLCLDVTRWVEEDLVQRFLEDPSAEVDWCTTLTIDGCPTCDTLWVQLTGLYLRYQTPLSQKTFGAQPTAESRDAEREWRRASIERTLGERVRMNRHAVVTSALMVPTLLFTLLHSPDDWVVEAAFVALVDVQINPAFGIDQHVIPGYVTALRRLLKHAGSV